MFTAVGKAYSAGAVALGAAVIGLLVSAVPAAAAGWSVTYQSASASGTSETTYPTVFTRAVSVEGTLITSAPAACYQVQLLVRQDLVTMPVDVADLCGAGSTSFSRSGYTNPTGSVAVRLCRADGGAVSDCGTAVPL
jgi:hypothetical protein